MFPLAGKAAGAVGHKALLIVWRDNVLHFAQIFKRLLEAVVQACFWKIVNHHLWDYAIEERLVDTELTSDLSLA